MEASARLMNVGATSPSCPAASKAEASQRERIVPTNWAKDSVQDLSLFGRPSDLVSRTLEFLIQSSYACPDRSALESSLLGITYSHDC